MKYYIIAGEASGDLHSANLIKEIKKLDPKAVFRGWGGDLMQQQNTVLVKHYKDIAYMGFLEVVLHLSDIFKNIKLCKKDILQFAPDALILVDYPGFNLRIADFAKKLVLSSQLPALKIFYYISPQVWAWKSSRVKKIRAFVDRMFVILPFEKSFYAKYDYYVDFVGHPLLDEIENYKNIQNSAGARLQRVTPNSELKTRNPEPKTRNPEPETHNPEPGTLNTEPETRNPKPIIALLPGSRKQEIDKMLSIMLKLTPSFPDYQFVIAGVNSMPDGFYNKYTSASPDIRIVYNQTYSLLANATAAVVTSGTATLETALFEVPEIVCYKGNYLSYLLAKSFVKIKYISLVNLIMDKKVVTELIQRDLTESNLRKELELILNNTETKERIQKDYKELKQILGGSGASAKTAQLIYKLTNDH